MGPYSPEHEEQRQGDDACKHSDYGRADDEGWLIDALVVLDRRVAKVVHSTDGRTTENTSDCDSPPRNVIICADSDKGGQEDDDRDEKGDGRKATGVCYLQVRLVVCQVDGSVADEMLREVRIRAATTAPSHSPCTKSIYHPW